MNQIRISLYNAFISAAVVVGTFISATELDNYVGASRWGYLIAIITGIVLALNVFLNAKKTSFFYPLFSEKHTLISAGLKLLRFYEHLIKPLIIFILTMFVLIISSSPLLLGILLVEIILYYVLFETVKDHDFEQNKEKSILYIINTLSIHFLGVTVLTNFSVSGDLFLPIAIVGYVATLLFTIINITSLQPHRVLSVIQKAPIIYTVLFAFCNWIYKYKRIAIDNL